jgi:4,5-dihydroxyphthalate decarboxylase
MPPLRLSVCLSRNAMTAPIISGEVIPEGIDWTVTAAHPSEMFWRQLKFAEFDISEMSLSSLSIAAAHGVRDWVAIPVFTTRRFFHTGIIVRDGAGIDTPADLAGKRVGVPEYQQTAALWTRAALHHEFGVAPETMQWFMERPPERSHGGSTGFMPPPGVELTYISTDTNLGEMLETGQLDAAIVYLGARNLVDRNSRGSEEIAGLRPLFADPLAEGVRYYEKTGLLPVNHTVVIRRSLLEESPWVALNAFSAFVDAKEAALAPLVGRGGPELRQDSGLLDPWAQIGAIPASAIARVRHVDPLPYGLRGQSAVLEALGTYLLEQGLVTTPVEVMKLFAPSTRDL